MPLAYSRYGGVICLPISYVCQLFSTRKYGTCLTATSRRFFVRYLKRACVMRNSGVCCGGVVPYENIRIRESLRVFLQKVTNLLNTP